MTRRQPWRTFPLVLLLYVNFCNLAIRSHVKTHYLTCAKGWWIEWVAWRLLIYTSLCQIARNRLSLMQNITVLLEYDNNHLLINSYKTTCRNHSCISLSHSNSYSASHDNWCTATLWNRIMTAQCEGMGEVGSARYEPGTTSPHAGA